MDTKTAEKKEKEYRIKALGVIFISKIDHHI